MRGKFFIRTPTSIMKRVSRGVPEDKVSNFSRLGSLMLTTVSASLVGRIARRNLTRDEAGWGN